MIVSLCLGAIDCHLYKRPRAAFVLGVLASLGRPEAWPFLGLYSLWMWRAAAVDALAGRRRLGCAGRCCGSGSRRSPRGPRSWRPATRWTPAARLTSDQVGGTIQRFLGLHELPLELAALLGVVLALVRRDRVTLVLAGGDRGCGS